MAVYLITGGAGFIGSHLCEHLLESGHTAVVLDDLSTGKRENVPSGVQLIPACMLTPHLIHSLTETVDGIFHMAAIASVQKCSEEWSFTHSVNVTATLTIFEAARTHKKPVVYASSAAVYGTPAFLPLDEKAPLAPISGYGLDKKCTEDYARIGATHSPLRSIGLRFFNVYGERQDPKSPYSGVISLFMGAASENKPLTILGTGDQTRDFVYVGDVARALIACMNRLHQTVDDKGFFQVYNVATGQECSIHTLAQKILRISGNDGAIAYAPPRLGDIQHSLGDASALGENMNWQPKVDLEDGLRRLWHSLKQAI